MNPRLPGAVALAEVLAASAGSSAGPSGGGNGLKGRTVSVTWASDDEAAFLAMVKPWEQRTGATVRYTGTRNVNAILATGVASGVSANRDKDRLLRSARE